MNIFTVIITQPLANGLIFFYRILGGNLGLAIIGFSLFLRFILSPLTKPYMESMKKMKDFQKDIDKIKKRHKDDKVKLAQAQSDFYKEKGINPSAGCLPYLLQIVVLIALFRLFINVLSPDIDTVSKFNEYLYEPLRFSETDTIDTKFLYLDITQPDKHKVEGLPFALPGLFLITASILQFVSAKMSTPYIEIEKKIAKKTPEKSDDIQVAMQSYMIYMFPFMTLFIGLQFPSGLALYWLVFSGFQAFQQYRTSGLGGLRSWVDRVNMARN